MKNASSAIGWAILVLFFVVLIFMVCSPGLHGQTIPPQFIPLRSDSASVTPLVPPTLPIEPCQAGETFTFGTLPGSPAVNQQACITDSSSNSSCSAGGGSSVVRCSWNGSAWTFVSLGTTVTNNSTEIDQLGSVGIRIARPPDGKCFSGSNPSALCHGTLKGGVPPGNGNVVPEYAKLRATNTTNDLLLLEQSVGQWWELYDAHDYHFIRLFTHNNDGNGFACQPTNGVMWSNTVPGRIYYYTNGNGSSGAGGAGCTGGLQLRRMDMGAAPYTPPFTDTLVHTFTTIGTYPNTLTGALTTPNQIQCGEECNLSDDDQWIGGFIYCGSGCHTVGGHDLNNDNYGQEIFTYNLNTNTTHQLVMNFVGCTGSTQCFAPHTCDKAVDSSCTYSLDGAGTTDNFSPSPTGTYFMLCTEFSSSFTSGITVHPGGGIESWTNALGFVGMASPQGGSHHETGYDVAGNEVIIGEWDFNLTIDGRTVRYALMSDPTKLAGEVVPNSWTGGYHMSYRVHSGAAKGWGVWSNFNGINGFGTGWGTAEIDVVGLVTPETNPITVHNPGTFRRVAISYSSKGSPPDYWAEPHATTNSDLTKIFWGTNWGVNGGQDYPFVIELNTTINPDTCSVTAPANGSTQLGTITVQGAATAGQGIVTTQFKVDGNNLGAGQTGTTPSIPWDTTGGLGGGANNGPHTLSCTCSDTGGGSGTCNNVTVTVNNPPPPPSPLSIIGNGLIFGGGTKLQ